MLVGPGLGVYLTGAISSTHRLIQDCREMLKHAGLAPELHEATGAALMAAAAANEERNRVVHDMWMRVDFGSPRSEAEPTWLSFRSVKGALGAVPTPRDVTYVDDVLDRLQRAQARIFALRSALWEVLPFFKGSALATGFSDLGKREGRLDQWILIMSDSFDLTPDGGIRAHSATEP